MDRTPPGPRLQGLVGAELRVLARELARAAGGDDNGVHQARKAMQRLRSMLRLARPLQPAWCRETEAELARLRRRLGALRDSAVRVERVAAMVAAGAAADDSAAVALQSLRDRHAATRKGLPGDFWPRFERGLARLRERLAEWPLADLRVEHVEAALEASRRQVRRAIRRARGRRQRRLRHRMRCRLRRHAAMRRVAARLLGRRDRRADALVEMARELGREGDLWLTCVALRASGPARKTRALRATLEAERRDLCRRHDEALRALQRRALRRPRTTEADSAEGRSLAARQAASMPASRMP